MKTHYETLGVPKTATKDEIKKAFRRLSMETHPDVAKSEANAEKFKQISEAHNVLSSDRERRRYDFDLEHGAKFGAHRRTGAHADGGFRGAGFGTGGRRGRGAAGMPSHSSAVHNFLDGIYRPSNFVVGVVLGMFAVVCVNSYLRDDDRRRITGKSELVEAWKNPSTGLWHQPAPWDATYRKLRPKLHLIPRENVQESRR